MPGSTDYNSISPGVAVQNYVSAKQGVEATIKTLRYPHHGYGKIIRRLRLNASAENICRAIAESDWGTGAALDKDDHPLILAVLDDIQHSRKPNTLLQLEARTVAS
jgi:hypothetical protein